MKSRHIDSIPVWPIGFLFLWQEKWMFELKKVPSQYMLQLEQRAGYRSIAVVQRGLGRYCLLSIYDMGARIQVAGVEQGVEPHALLQLISLAIRPNSAASVRVKNPKLWSPLTWLHTLGHGSRLLPQHWCKEGEAGVCCCTSSSLRKFNHFSCWPSGQGKQIHIIKPTKSIQVFLKEVPPNLQ